MLVLLLSEPPPVRVQGRGRLSIHDAIMTALPEVFTPGSDLGMWNLRIEETVSWLTWKELANQIRLAQTRFTSGNLSVGAAKIWSCVSFAPSGVISPERAPGTAVGLRPARAAVGPGTLHWEAFARRIFTLFLLAI